MDDPNFFWPDGFAPGVAKLYVRNERTMRAPIDAVWAWLISAPRWNAWFSNATKVRLPDGATTLAAGMHFTWAQSGVWLRSDVREFQPHKRLAWAAQSPLIKAYHTWDLQSDGDGTRVITDETQNGLMPTLVAPILKPRMLAVHDKWLESLERQAASGLP
jgi:uncharacterized protein YndB with AHSA1/START domain